MSDPPHQPRRRGREGPELKPPAPAQGRERRVTSGGDGGESSPPALASRDNALWTAVLRRTADAPETGGPRLREAICRTPPMLRSLAFALLATAALAMAGPNPASAQQNPDKRGASGLRGPSGQIPDQFVGRPRRQCFWTDRTSGGPFGSSGFCYAPSGSTIGTACFCRIAGRRGQRGRVVAASRPGPPPVVR